MLAVGLPYHLCGQRTTRLSVCDFSLCLQKLGVFTPKDHTALAIKVFWRYMQVMRDLQSSYWLEPAGG